MPAEPGGRPPALLAWSGGKDAAWALHRLRWGDEVEVVGLLATITEGDDRAAMQGIRVEVLRAQAEAVGLPLFESPVPPGCDNARYEAAFSATLAQARARWPGLCRVAFGDLLLADIRAWREALCRRLGWAPLFPLFGADTAALAREMLAGGLRAALCCVDTGRLGADFAGRAYDARLLADLPDGIDPCGEHGELHTCVADGPMFSAPLALARGGTAQCGDRFAYTDFVLAVD